MTCWKCATPVEAGARFCASCGSALGTICAKCGATAKPGGRFCSMCGSTLPDSAATAPANPRDLPPPAPLTGGERRQITVLFADLVGATSLSGELDPEELRALLREYQAACVASVRQFDGHIHQYAGDGVLAYFGYPSAHDNDAERAILSGLAIAAAVRALCATRRSRGEAGFSVRVGIHTGLVVVGEMGAGDAREMHAIGETPNIAARIQAETAPDSVCISAATLRLTAQRFHVRALGARPLKGVAREVELFAVDAVVSIDPERSLAAAPLVGREAELQHLIERWSLASQGRGQAVLVSGEGGIGKSRLIAALRDRAGLPGDAWRSIYCSPFYQNSALHPVIDQIERAVKLTKDRKGGSRGAALRQLLQESGMANEMTVALMASLLDIEGDYREVLRDLAPDQRRRRTLDTLVAWLHADSQRQPLIVVVEDLHWVDASTRDFLASLLERVGDHRMLVVLTFRPEFVPTWTLHGHMSMIALPRLVPEQVRGVALGVAQGSELSAQLLEEIVRRTDGVPLFVEELTKALLGAGGDAALRDIPATLRDSLTARLDRLGAAKSVAQLAAVLGREFDYAVLQAVCDIPAPELESMLAELNHADIIHQSGVPPHSRYMFKHALIQEAAYDTILLSARQKQHKHIALAYQERFADIARTRPELVAHHFSRALMPAEALGCLQRAGELAVARSGYNEALGHLKLALEQIELLPATPERAAVELALRVKVGPALQALRGMNAPESVENYARACELAEGVGDRPERFMALWGDWLSKTSSGAVVAASHRAEELVSLSRRLGDDAYVLQAHHSRWTNYFMLGDAAVSRADTLRGIELYDSERHRDHRHLYGGHDPGVCAHGVGASAALLTGHAGEAVALSDRVVEIARALDHPFSLSLAHAWSGFVSAATADLARLLASGESLAGMVEKHGFIQWSGCGEIFIGAARASKGETSYGLKLVDQGVETTAAKGQRMWYPFLLATAAQAHQKSGNQARTLNLLTEAIDLARKLEIRWYLPEMERLRAEVQLQAGAIGETEASHRFAECAQMARSQSASLLAWRSDLSRARLLARQGRTNEAKACLESIGVMATSGQDAPEILESKRLLAGL